jgi:hypothetical protein
MQVPKSWEVVRDLLDEDIRERFEKPVYDSSEKEMRIAAYWIENAPLVASVLQLSRVIAKIHAKM